MFFLQKNMAVVLLALLVLKMMAIPLACLQYRLNKDFIAANLCENKAKPQLQCEGKCHLKKEIEKNSDAPNPSGEKSTVKLSVSDFLLTNTSLLLEIATTANSCQATYCGSNYSHLYSCVVFHPPLLG